MKQIEMELQGSQDASWQVLAAEAVPPIGSVIISPSGIRYTVQRIEFYFAGNSAHPDTVASIRLIIALQ